MVCWGPNNSRQGAGRTYTVVCARGHSTRYHGTVDKADACEVCMQGTAASLPSHQEGEESTFEESGPLHSTKVLSRSPNFPVRDGQNSL